MQKLLTIFSLVGVLLFLSSPTVTAQTASLESVKRIRLRSSGSIINDGVIQGYYFFYKMDRKSRKTNVYGLQILDQNLEKIALKKIEGPKHLVLLEGVYNGNSIMLKFYDRKGKKYDFKQYDANAKLITSKSMDVRRLYAAASKSSTGSDDEIDGVSLFSIPGKGFAHILMKKHKKVGFQIDYMSDDGETYWDYSSNKDTKEVFFAEFLAANEDILLLSVISKKKLLSKKLRYSVLALDINTGEKLYEKPLEDKNRPVQVMNAFIDPSTKKATLFGLYYKKGGDPIKDKSVGLFSYTLDNDGKYENKELTSWAKGVSKFLPVNAKGNMKGKGYIFFHKIVRTADDKILAVGEMFNKEANALGLIARDVSLAKIVVKDMYVFEFNSEFKLQGVEVFEKTKASVNLESGALLTGPQRLAYSVNYRGGFGYEYTQRNQDNSIFTFGYINREKKKGAKTKYIFGAVTYADGEYTSDKVDLGRRASNIAVFPAKPGHVMIIEYIRKEKKLEMRLEKINF
ncbi:MAG: DUF6770 family protein [Saprospiraceae bacterium]